MAPTPSGASLHYGLPYSIWQAIIIFCYISPICPETLSGWICTKFGIGGPLAGVINCAEFFVDWFRGIDFVGG